MIAIDTSTHSRLAEDVRGFQLLAALLQHHAGIYMPHTEKNASLMASRLQSVLKRHSLQKYRELHTAIESGNRTLLVEVIEALTTNKTEFFRERQHIDFLANALPELLAENRDAGRRELRLWCAAASTGQEPYTLAMTLRENVDDLHLWNVKFLASDIDTKVLKKAANGIYNEHEMLGLSPELRSSYFRPVKVKDAAMSQALPELRDMIRFAEFNLMTDPYPFEHKFDVVFCRNVLIYFDRETQGIVVEKLVKSLRVGGLLFIGHTETGVPKPPNLDTLAVAVYRKNSEVG